MICEKVYKPIQSYECLNSCITGYSNYNGFNVCCDDVFFIGDGFDISIIKKDIPTIGARLYESNFDFMDNVGIKYVIDKFACREEAESFLDNAVKEEKTLSIKVSSELLEHSRVFRQTENSPHYLNIIGMSESKLYIADGYVPTSDPTSYDGLVDKNAIIEAWQKMEFRYILTDYDNVSKSLTCVKEIANKKLIKQLSDYIANDVEKMVIGELLNYLENCIKCNKDNKLVKDTFIKVNYQLKIYGYITSKRYIYEKIARDWCDNELVNRYKQIIDRWNKVCILLLKAGYGNSLKQLLLTKENILNLIEEEMSILNEILCRYK